MQHNIDFDYTSFKPRKGHLLIATPPQEDVVKTASGIVVERRSVLDRPCYGEVVASADEDIPVGSNVVYPNTDGIDCVFNGQKGFVLLKVDSVIGLVG